MSALMHFLPWVGTGLAAEGASLALQVGATPVPVTLRRLGPGDVRRLADGLVLRQDPAPQSVGFPSSCLASVAFGDTTLPWQFTPQAPDAQGLLPPWLTLVVVGDDEGLITTRPGGLQVLKINTARLPTFRELPAFAHVQHNAPGAGSDVAAALAQGSARLLAAQRLAPARSYLACLVPTYEAGRLAGLGASVPDPVSATPAWSGDGEVELPVYVSWRFGTSAEADLESVVRRVAQATAPALPTPPALDLAALADTADVAYRGVLRAINADPGPPPASAVVALQTLLDQGAGERRVGLPWLGHGAGAGAGTHWAETLNRDPRLRALAGLGAELVRQQQDALVDAFWRRAGAAPRAQRLFIGATLAATVATRLVAKHLAAAGPTKVLMALRPTATAAAIATATGTTMFMFARVAPPAGEAVVLPATLRRIAGSRRLRAGAALPALVQDNLLRAPRSAVDPLFAMNMLVAPAGSEPAVPDVPVPRPANVNEAQLAQAALATMFAAVQARAQLSMRVDLGDFVSGPVSGTAAPRGSTLLDTPLVPALTALDPRLVLPGVDALPDDSLLALAIDGAAVEALLVGANHELVRELQWRGAPVRPDATLLPYAWPALPHAPVAHWDATVALGAHAPHLQATVIVLRSALVNRLPGFEPWLVQAQAVTGGRRPSTATMAATFEGRLGDDIAYFGFLLTADALAGRDGGAGWYLTFQQGSGRPRFGLDETPVESFARWSDLDWSRVDDSGGRLHLDPAPQPQNPASLSWGRDGAQMAAILLQKPVRFAIHASMIPGLAGPMGEHT